MNCPIPHCTVQIPSGLILCGQHWQRLPQDLKAGLIWNHPDVAKQRKTRPKAGAYEELLRRACGHLGLKDFTTS